MEFLSNKLLDSFAVFSGINLKLLIMKFFFIFLQACNLITIWKKAQNLKLLNFQSWYALQVSKLELKITQYKKESVGGEIKYKGKKPKMSRSSFCTQHDSNVRARTLDYFPSISPCCLEQGFISCWLKFKIINNTIKTIKNVSSILKIHQNITGVYPRSICWLLLSFSSCGNNSWAMSILIKLSLPSHLIYKKAACLRK